MLACVIAYVLEELNLKGVASLLYIIMTAILVKNSHNKRPVLGGSSPLVSIPYMSTHPVSPIPYFSEDSESRVGRIIFFPFLCIQYSILQSSQKPYCLSLDFYLLITTKATKFMTPINKWSDDQLVHLFTEGTSEAFNELVRRYQADVLRYIYVAVNDDSLAEDLFQDTFIKVMHILKDGKYRSRGKFKPWLMRVTHNMVMDYFRHTGVRLQPVSSDLNHYIISTTSAPEVYEQEELQLQEQQYAFLEQQVASLPPEQREVLEMRIWKNMSFKDIAAHTGVSINTALGRMRYALINLRKASRKDFPSL